jgi:acylphosphatase
MNIKRYRVTGRVQGVGFRYFVWREAEVLGIDGWVRNCADGTVEALARGSTHDLDRFQNRLEEGPRWSRVTSVAVTDEPDQAVSDGFEIRRDKV